MKAEILNQDINTLNEPIDTSKLPFINGYFVKLRPGNFGKHYHYYKQGENKKLRGHVFFFNYVLVNKEGYIVNHNGEREVNAVYTSCALETHMYYMFQNICSKQTNHKRKRDRYE